MSNSCDTLKQYYDSWSHHRPLSHDLFDKSFSFKGPIDQTNNIDDFIGMLDQFAPLVESIEFKHRIKDGEKAVAIYTVKTKLPIKPMDCAEVFTFEHGKIKTIELFFDPREFEKEMAKMNSATA